MGGLQGRKHERAHLFAGYYARPESKGHDGNRQEKAYWWAMQGLELTGLGGRVDTAGAIQKV